MTIESVANLALPILFTVLTILMMPVYGRFLLSPPTCGVLETFCTPSFVCEKENL
jgi:hypothetical protein